jgi:hypothetical protein
MSNAKWTAADVPDQSGRVVIITGAHTGIGFEPPPSSPPAEPTSCSWCATSTRARTPGADRRGKPARRRRTAAAHLASLDSVRAAAEDLRNRARVSQAGKV